METIFADNGWLNILGSVALTLAGFVANKYIIPFLNVGRRKKYAEYIAAIAEEAIDELRTKYPDKTWLEHLQEAIEVVISITAIDADIAARAVKAAAARR